MTTTTTAKKKLMFLACGSFSPPTPMHLRLFEIARDHYRQKNKYDVIGGIISPVHDMYNKNGLVAARHRCAMVKISVQSSDWIRLSDWESIDQNKWTPTRKSLQYHQNTINAILKNVNECGNDMIPSWIPENIRQHQGDKIHVKLLCGADLLESFSKPGLWDENDIEAILSEHGIVVVSRQGCNPEKFIFESDLLNKHRKNITIVTNWVRNEVSSTLARRHLKRGLSVKYMLDDNVVEYIRQNDLYQETNCILTPNNNESIPTRPLSPTYINDNYIKKISITNFQCDAMDETDYSLRKSFVSDVAINMDGDQPVTNGRPKLFACNSSNSSASAKNRRHSRPGQAVQIRTDVNGTRTIDHEDEVGECKISTITLPSENKALEKKIEYLSDNQLDKITNGVYGLKGSYSGGSDSNSTVATESLETLSVECLPSTSKRSQNDLIQFVFTSHGIRVISDKEYVV